MPNSTRQRINVAIFDGVQPVEERVCLCVSMPSGESAILYQGRVYPLTDGNRIDLSGPIVEKAAACPEPSAKAAVEIIWGAETAYALVSGSSAFRTAVRAALIGFGAAVLREGQYVGDPLGSFTPDWFLRFSGTGLDRDAIQRAAIAATDPTHSWVVDATREDLRIQLLTTELLEARANNATLRAELAKVRLRFAELNAANSADVAQAIALAECIDAERQALRDALEEARRARSEAESAAAQIRDDRQPQVSSLKAVRSEVERVFSHLLPHVQLLRDTLEVISYEFRDRGPLYRALSQLNPKTGTFPQKWKKLQGVDAWERHISDGLSDAGRVYAQFDGEQRRFEVLVSYKSDQTQDLNWLRGRTVGQSVDRMIRIS